MAKAVDEITNDIRSQYTLAFYPQPTDTDGGYHPLRVSVRGGRYTIRARPGYGTAEIPPPPERRNDDPPYQAKIQRQNGRLFYRDDFSDKTSGWPNRENAKYTAKGYRLNGENSVAINGPFFSDFRAAVSISVGGGTGGGLVFRQLEAGYYVIVAYPARSASRPGVLVALHVDSSGTRNLQHWPLMSQASPTKNLRLEVRCQSTVCSVYEGEQFRGELKNITQLDGRIGLCVIGRGQALFTDLSAEEIR